MSGPWEKYQEQPETGPWQKYATPPPGDSAEIRSGHPTAELASKFYRPALELGTMAATGGIGTFFAGPIGGFAAGAAGYPIGKRVADDIDAYLGVAPQKKSKGVLGDLNDTFKDAQTGALIETTSLAGKAALQPIAKAFGEPLAHTYRGDIEALAKQFQVPLSLAARTGSNAVAKAESALHKFPLVTGAVESFKEGTTNALANLRNKLIRDGASPEEAEVIGQKVINSLSAQRDAHINALQAEAGAAQKALGTNLSREEIGEAVQKNIAEGSRDYQEKVVNPLYKQVEELAKDVKSPAPALEAEARRMLAQREGALGNDPQLMGMLKQIVPPEPPGPLVEGQALDPNNPLAKAIAAQLPPKKAREFGFSALKTTQEELGAAAEAERAARMQSARGAAFQDNPLSRDYGRLSAAARKDLEEFGPEGSKIGETLIQAKAAAKAGYDKYGTDNVLKVLQTAPEKVLDRAVRPGDVTRIREVWNALDPKGKEVFRGGVVNNLLEPKPGELFSREALAKRLADHGDGLKEVLRPDQLQALQQIAASRSDLPIDHPFFRRFLSTSAQGNPKRVVDYVISKTATPGAINKLRYSVGEETFKDLQDQAILALGNDKSGAFSPARFAQRVDAIGLPNFKTMMSGEKADEAMALYKLSRAADTPNRLFPNPSGTAQASEAISTVKRAINNPIRTLLEQMVAKGAWKALNAGSRLATAAPKVGGAVARTAGTVTADQLGQ